jgi:hypothetical protein
MLVYSSTIKKIDDTLFPRSWRELHVHWTCSQCRPQVTIATAIIFCHRFFLRQSHAKNDRRVGCFTLWNVYFLWNLIHLNF